MSSRTAAGHERASRPGRRLPAWLGRLGRHPAAGTALRLLGGLLLLAILLPAALGSPEHRDNPAGWLLFGVFWAALTPLSALFGPVWKAVNPLRPAAALLAGPDRREMPTAAGVWPAAVALMLFAWLDLVIVPHPLTVAVVVAAYVVVSLVGGAGYGSDWFATADPFEVWSSTVGHLSPLGTDPQGTLRLRSPRSLLATTPAPPGLLAVLVAVVGADIFDAVSETGRWEAATLGRAGVGDVVVPTAGLAACLAVVGALAWMVTRRRAYLVPALIPLAAGYAVAHHLAPLLLETQVALALLSDPFDRGWDLFGMADLPLDVEIVPLALAAAVQIGALVAGHVVAVVVAHDRTVMRFDPRTARAVQFPVRTLIVVSALGAIALRFAP